MKNIYTVEIVGEANDITPIIKKDNIVILTEFNGLLMMDNASFTDWDKIFIFPDSEKAEYFVKNFKPNMRKYQEGMLDGDYIFHVITCRYPIPDKVYADQLHR